MGWRLHLAGSWVAILVVLQTQLMSSAFIAAQHSGFGLGAPDATNGRQVVKFVSEPGHPLGI